MEDTVAGVLGHETASLKGVHSNKDDECMEDGRKGNNSYHNLVETDMASWEVEIESSGGGKKDSSSIEHSYSDTTTTPHTWKHFFFNGWSPNLR